MEVNSNGTPPSLPGLLEAPDVGMSPPLQTYKRPAFPVGYLLQYCLKEDIIKEVYYQPLYSIIKQYITSPCTVSSGPSI